MSELPTDEQLIEFEARRLRNTSSKQLAIFAELGITPARYYQLLHRAVLEGDAAKHDPHTAGLVRARLNTLPAYLRP